MYALRPYVEGSFPIDEKNQQFGDHALILTNRDAFMQRLESTLKNETFIRKSDLVEYVDDKHTGELGPFKKFDRFSYQYEWRLVCYGGSGKPRKIRLGSLRDISTILPANEVNHRIQIHPK